MLCRTLSASGTIVLYDAGGGKGKDNLNFETLNLEQHEMYKRTLVIETPMIKANREQEERQVTVVEKPVL